MILTHTVEGMEIIKKECKNMIDILEQTPEWDIKQLMNIYNLHGQLELQMKTNHT